MANSKKLIYSNDRHFFCEWNYNSLEGQNGCLKIIFATPVHNYLLFINYQNMPFVFSS